MNRGQATSAILAKNMKFFFSGETNHFNSQSDFKLDKLMFAVIIQFGCHKPIRKVQK